MQSIKKPLPRLIAASLTALLFWGAWPAAGFAPLLFIALVPLLFLEDVVHGQKKEKQKARLFTYAYWCFFLFNLLTTWWIWFASPAGMFLAVLANALLMTFTFQLFHFTRLRMGNAWGYTSLPVYWIAFEHLHMDWDLSWPWLNFGNGFAAWADMVQWYEYTGTQGGTLWIIVANILFFRAWASGAELRKRWLQRAAAWILVPLALSPLIKFQVKDSAKTAEIVVVQPNIDPYNEKFSGSSDEQLGKMLRLGIPLLTQDTKALIFPETALPDGIWSEQVNSHPQIERLKELNRVFPTLSIMAGLSYYRMFNPGEELTSTARFFRDGPEQYDAYNAALQVRADGPFQFHYKSKLVPGVEKMPFPQVFGIIEEYAIDLGGTTGSLGVQDTPTVFRSPVVNGAPVICYESVYGDYIGEYIRKGANLICIMTNDGWWSDTPGHRQHCQYARLRAIEQRRAIARSANTGISCFIDSRGEISQPLAWWTPGAIKARLPLNEELTFYGRHGDYPGRAALLLGIFSAGITLLSILRSRGRKGVY